MKRLEEEIKAVQQSIEDLTNEIYKRNLKCGRPSNAQKDDDFKEQLRLNYYLKGLIVAKNFIEMEK